MKSPDGVLNKFLAKSKVPFFYGPTPSYVGQAYSYQFLVSLQCETSEIYAQRGFSAKLFDIFQIECKIKRDGTSLYGKYPTDRDKKTYKRVRNSTNQQK